MHRDLKPANVFITTQGVVKVGDLGLGRYFSNNTVEAHSLVGTPYYMSPERLHEDGYSFKSDIWSLGCLLYEMAALRSPFWGENLSLVALCKKIDDCDYPPLPAGGYSVALMNLIRECLVNVPENRPDAAKVYSIAKDMYDKLSAK
jgi:NIMA (never in mitosis gene a)-related kinase